MIALGIGGLLVALALTLGALALAGDDVGDLVRPELSTPTASGSSPATPSETPGDDRTETPTPTHSADDSSGHGSDGSGDDSSGHGSGDDSSGPGSGDDHSDDDD